MTTESLIVELDAKVGKFETSMKSASSAVKMVGDETSTTDKRLDSFNKTAIATATSGNKISNSLGGVGRSAGMAGIQIQQFVGQVQGGQSAMLALSQQGADLGFVLGAPLAGAVIGISASIAGFLIPQLIGAQVETEGLVDRIIDLEEITNRTSAQNRLIAQEKDKDINKLSEENNVIAEQIKLLEERLRAQTTAGVGTGAGDFAVPLSAEENQKKYAASIKETKESLTTLRAELDTNNQTIIKTLDEVSALNQAESESVEISTRYTDSLQKQIIALEQGAKAAEIYAATQALSGTEQEGQLDSVIEMINRKYELIEAEKQLAELERDKASAAKEQEKVEEQENAKAALEQENQEKRLEMLRQFALTKEEFLFEQYFKELEMLNEYQEAVGASDEQLYSKRIELAKKFASDLERAKGKEIKTTEQAEDKKGMSLEEGAQVAARVGEALLGDNKAVQSAVAVIDTLAGVNKALSRNDFATAAVVALAGFANVQKINATQKGSSGSGGSTPTQAPQESFSPEQSEIGLDFRSEESSTSNVIRFDTETGDQLIDALMGVMNDSIRNGRG